MVQRYVLLKQVPLPYGNVFSFFFFTMSAKNKMLEKKKLQKFKSQTFEEKKTNVNSQGQVLFF